MTKSDEHLPMDTTTDWFWEGNVADSLARYLSAAGWQIASKANSHSKERGVDIHASRGDAMLLIEVKGYPSKNYRDPRRAGERKPTNPTNQAQHWYSHAVLKAMRLQTKYPDAKVAVAFPDFPRYRTLFQETQGAFKKLDLALLLITKDGDVQEFGLPPVLTRTR